MLNSCVMFNSHLQGAMSVAQEIHCPQFESVLQALDTD